MDYEDSALLQFAHGPTRRGLFDDLALEHVLDAAFDTSTLGLEGPFDATFDDVRLGRFAPTRLALDGGWSPLGGGDRTEARATVTWPHLGAIPRTDAVWRGTIIARAVVAPGRVDRVSSGWPDLATLDDAIATPPTDPVALEQARRDVLRTRLRAGAAAPDAVDDGFIDRLLDRSGAASVGDLADRHRADLATGRVTVTFAAPGEPVAVPRRFPVAVALLVRGAAHRVVDLLEESKAVQCVLQPEVERPRDPELRCRNPVVVAWVRPGIVLDDVGWPSAGPISPAATARRARREAAGPWLAREGVALVPYDPPV